MWVDGIHLKVRLEQDKVCLLVMIGVRADGRKELIALDDGYRETPRPARTPPGRRCAGWGRASDEQNCCTFLLYPSRGH
jgi:hypothetical protein